MEVRSSEGLGVTSVAWNEDTYSRQYSGLDKLSAHAMLPVTEPRVFEDRGRTIHASWGEIG